MKSNINKVTFGDIKGNHPLLKKQIEIAVKASGCDAPVLIYGKTGTGKELLSRAIHNNSARKEKAFEAQNLSAVPANLFESLFFGTESGAFTDAVESKGLFQLADGGTVLLDELNSMPVFLQSKLLRFLQDGLVRRLGGLTEEAVDVRVIAAVNEDPEELVERGILRADLFYRLNVIRINVPSLDEHKEDIPIYVEHFIEKANRRYGKEIKGVSDDVISELG